MVVSLFIHQGREAEFEQFESEAAKIMKRYGGAVERRIVCAPQAGDAVPREVHIVTFPDEKAFERYRADPGLGALAELRSRAIRQTTVWRGIDRPLFSSSG